MRVISTSVVLAISLCGCESKSSSNTSDGAEKIPDLAFVTNGEADFWNIAKAGALAAQKDFNLKVDVRMPAGGVVDQKRIVEDLLARKVDGIAISPIDPDNQTELINMACERTRVITHDSDAPGTKRLCYVGMLNYTAGRMCGELVKEALPDGGSIVILIGRLEQDNAKKRRQGLIDELMDRPEDSKRFDPPGTVVKGDKYTVLDTRTDQFDTSRAKQNAEDMIVSYPELKCMVGLFEYNNPAILEALSAAGKLNKIKVVAFDEADATLQGIKDGTVHGTIVQDPYHYGYESMRILGELVRGNDGALPKDGFLNLPARKIRKDNVDAFWTELKANLAAGKGG